MKKFFAIFAVMFAVIFVGKVSAQEVYVGTTGGLDFYVDTNTIVVAGKPDGRTYSTFYVDVRKYNSNGSLNNVNQWKFYEAIYNRSNGDYTWFFDYYLSGTRIRVSSNPIAVQILRTCQRYDSRIDRI